LCGTHPANADSEVSPATRSKKKLKAATPVPLTPAAQTLLLRHPELLLQDTQTIEDKLMGLQVQAFLTCVCLYGGLFCFLHAHSRFALSYREPLSTLLQW
jgi:hypothetical protein